MNARSATLFLLVFHLVPSCQCTGASWVLLCIPRVDTKAQVATWSRMCCFWGRTSEWQVEAWHDWRVGTSVLRHCNGCFHFQQCSVDRYHDVTSRGCQLREFLPGSPHRVSIKLIFLWKQRKHAQSKQLQCLRHLTAAAWTLALPVFDSLTDCVQTQLLGLHDGSTLIAAWSAV